MKCVTVALTVLLLLAVPCLAQDDPLLTVEGLESYKLGQAPPAKSGFPGLTTKKVEVLENQEGEEYRTTYLKFFQQGHYLGKARLDDQGRLDEIIIVDPRVRYEGGFAVGSTWDEVQRVFPMVRIQYTYVMDKIFADSPQVKGLQAHFNRSDYRGAKPLDGEWMQLDESTLNSEAKVEALRLFWVPESD